MPNRILLVDDEISVLNALKRVFRRYDYNVVICSSAQEAIKELESSGSFDLVISDYKMPQMGGVEFLRIVMERWPSVVRMILSGYADSSEIKTALQDGVVSKFIGKPWDENDLIHSVTNGLLNKDDSEDAKI